MPNVIIPRYKGLFRYVGSATHLSKMVSVRRVALGMNSFTVNFLLTDNSIFTVTKLPIRRTPLLGGQ